jgi:tRNA (guanine-N7-)-methyltransferase
MSFGLAKDRDLSDEGVGIPRAELPPLPDEILTNREAGRIDPRKWFPDPSLPFDIEIGSGKGTFLVNQGPRDPGANYLGIEHAREFYLYAADRVRRRGIPNVRMLNSDAVEFLRWRVPDGTVRTIHLYYSDPWPKKKHHKNRVIQDAFLAEVARVLRPPTTGDNCSEMHRGGELRVVTDHPDLWVWYESHFARWARADVKGTSCDQVFLREMFTPPEWVGDGNVIGTNYEIKTRAAGRDPRSCVLRRARQT